VGPDGDFVSGAEQVAGHGVPHESQSEESKFGHEIGLYEIRRAWDKSAAESTAGQVPPGETERV